MNVTARSRNYSSAAKLPNVIEVNRKKHHALKGRNLKHPFRMRFIFIRQPGVETPGYNLPSRWDDENEPNFEFP